MSDAFTLVETDERHLELLSMDAVKELHAELLPPRTFLDLDLTKVLDVPISFVSTLLRL